MEGYAAVFPCRGSRCNYHAKVYHRRLTPCHKKVGKRCLLTSLPSEILQQIALHLGVFSQASFAVSHAIVCDAIGTGPWDLFKRPEYSRTRAEFVDLLLSDYVDEDCYGSPWCECVIPCQQCALVHSIKSNEVGEPLVTRSLLADDTATFDLCDGAYSIPQRCIKLALERSSVRNRYGSCTAFLRCSGSKQLDIPPSKINSNQEPDRAELCFSYQRLDEKPKASKQNSPSNHPRLSQSGGNLMTRARRFRSRLFETRAYIQGREWRFYFPMTLFFFVPGSKPFRVRQKLKNGDVLEQAGTPRRERNDTAVEAENNVSTASNPYDQTGWARYYEDIEAREASDMYRPPYVDTLYEGKSDRIPWYDRPCIEAFLDGWSRTKLAKSMRRWFVDGEGSGNSDTKPIGRDIVYEEYDSASDLEEVEEIYNHNLADDESSYQGDVDGRGSPSIRRRISTSCKRLRRNRTKKKSILLNELQSSAGEDTARTSSRSITLRYSIKPKVANGSFLVHAKYSFRDTGSELLCGDLRNLAFSICPHVNTFSKGVAPHRPFENRNPILTLPDPLMSCATGSSYLGLRRGGLHTMYEDSCWYCATDYSVKLAYHGENPKYVAEVVIDAWHEITPTQIAEGYPRELLDTGGGSRSIFERRYDEVCAKWHEWDHFLGNIRVDT